MWEVGREGRGKKKKIDSSLKSHTKCDFVVSVLFLEEKFE